MPSFGRQTTIIAGAHWNACYAPPNAVEVNGHRCGRLGRRVRLGLALLCRGGRGRLFSRRGWFLRRLFQFLVDVFGGRLWFLTSRESLRLRSFVRLTYSYFIALRREGGLKVLPQRDRIDLSGAS